MTAQNGEKFSNEIDGRLAELFGGAKPAVPTGGLTRPVSSPPSDKRECEGFNFLPFTDLKAMILSIEWEISDETMSQLIEETDQLQDIYEGQPVISSFLKLLGSVGRYVNHKRANAHPDSITLLHSIYNQLENVLTASVITDVEVKNILSGEIKKFKRLKKRLTALKDRATPREKKAPPADKPSRPAVVAEADLIIAGKPVPELAAARQGIDPGSQPEPRQDDLRQELADLKKWIKTEFDQLRNDIRSLCDRS